ncbi:hypothetical protein AVEN_59998-1 [Araneus ventricosus]|uniref:Uncharacterized protein n=1 Tax=Araneus ventricosus TaxID=182803 RepID=A0A4Y2CBC3_ARAVE|nr:hypothetical protein AVEN_59998-1 [Araneus ventricosus]
MKHKCPWRWGGASPASGLSPEENLVRLTLSASQKRIFTFTRSRVVYRVLERKKKKWTAHSLTGKYPTGIYSLFLGRSFSPPSAESESRIVFRQRGAGQRIKC